MAANNCLVDDFENAFEACLSSLTNANNNHLHDSDEIKTSVEQCTQKFLDCAKQLEAFFLQKRLLLATQKPEQIIIENITDLKNEIARKDLIIKHIYDRLQEWQSFLCDASPSPQPASGNGPQQIQRQPSLINHPQPGAVPPVPGQMPSPIGGPQQTQIRHASQVTPTPHMMTGAQQVPQMPPQAPPPPPSQSQQTQQQMQMMHMQPTQQQMMPPPTAANAAQQSASMMQSMQQPPSQISNQMQNQYMASPNQSSLQGPLAYLERTTSNIGMPESRR